MKKYTVIFPEAIGHGFNYKVSVEFVETDNIKEYIQNEYNGDVYFVFDGHVTHSTN